MASTSEGKHFVMTKLVTFCMILMIISFMILV
jgi:hypothetical protein